MATTKPALERPRRASARSGKSESGSAPSSTSACSRPSAAAASIPAVPSPRCSGTPPHAPLNDSRPLSSDTRPGSTPGAIPMSRAPCTLPRRSAERNRTPGRPASLLAADAIDDADSESDGRPSTTTAPGADLAVDVVGSKDRLGQLRPRVRVFVGEAGAADDADGVGAVELTDVAQLVGDQVEGLRPRRLREPAAAFDRDRGALRRPAQDER